MATRQNTLLLKRSNIIGKIPPLSGLTLGEMALNTADAKLYSLYTSGSPSPSEVRQIGWDRISRTGDTVTGDFNIFGDVAISGSSLPSGYALTVTGDTDIVGDLYVEGDIDYDGNLIVSGSGVFQSGLTANTIYTDYIDFNTGATVPQSVGRVSWDSGTGTLNIAVGDSGTGLIDLQVGQEEIVRVYNSEATTLAKGEIVYVSGSQGNRPAVKRALATSDGYSVTTLGMVDRNIASGAEGYVTTFGIISNLNTLGLTGGTAIWLSGTIPGGYTSVKPIAPIHTVLIGYVVRVSATVGSIFVNISNGWELDELHDVRISAATEGDLLIRSSYSGTPVWVNTKTLNGSYTITGNTNIGGNLVVSGTTFLKGLSATTISATTIGTSGDCIDDIYVSNIHSCSPLNINPLDEGNVYFGSTSAVTIDLSNNRVGIGTSTPSTLLHVVGSYTGGTDALIPQMLFQNSNTIPNTNKTAIIRTTVGSGYVAGGYPEIWLESQETSTGVGLTKLRTVSNHPLLFYTNDIERGRFGHTGNFGLNTQSPAGILHARTGLNKNIIFTSGATRNLIRSLIDGNSDYVGLEIDTLDLNIKTNGVDRVIINSSGDTGIGTITPTAKLHINNTTSGNTFLAEDSTNPDSTPFVIDASGNTGIGTLTPQFKLEVNGTSVSRDYTRVYAGAGNIVSSISWLSTDSGIINLYNGGISTVQINTNGDSYYNGGNIGIGITIPTEKLDVAGKTKTINLQVTSATTTGDLTATGNSNLQAITGTSLDISGNTSSDLVKITQTGSGNAFVVEDSTRPDSSPFVIDASGNTGIGIVTPTVKLHLSGNSIFEQSKLTINQKDGIVGIDIVNSGESMYQLSNSITDWCIVGKTPSEFYFYNSLNVPIRFYTNASEKMTVLGNGNVGIGITSPTAKLHINNTTSGNTFLAEDDTNPDSSPFVIDASGNTGIGTLTPTVKLQVSGKTIINSTLSGSSFEKAITITNTSQEIFYVRGFGDALLANTLYLGVQNGNNFIGPGSLRIQSGQVTGNPFVQFNHNNGTTAFRILSNTNLELQPSAGNVLIGTTNDLGYKLNVNGSTNIGGDLVVSGITGTTWFSGNSSSDLVRVTQTGSGNAFVVEDNTNPDSSPFVIDASGNTGIGTLTPQAKLDVSGTTRITGSITSNTITEYFNTLQGTQNISSGLTPFSVTTHTLFAPTISSQATNARPYGLSIVPSFNGTIDSKHAVYISNTNTSPTSPGFNTSLVITSLGANELGQFIRVSGSSTIGSYIDQAQTGQVITRTPSGGIGLSMNRNSTLEVAYTPINTFQQLSGTPSPSIFEYRNISSGNTTEINGLDLLNSSTAKFSSTLGNNAGINLRLGITNALGVSSRYAKIAAIAPNQSTLPDVIDLGLYVSDTGGTTTNAIYIKGSDQNVGIGVTSPTAKLHINNTTSGNTFLAEDSTNPDSSPFLIDSSGNVGIGTLTPTAKLQVRVNDLIPGNAGFSVTDSGNTESYFTVSNVGQVGIRTPFTGSNYQFIITNTNPSFSNAQVRFNVSGDYAFSMLDNQGYGFSSSPSSISINTRSTQGNINIWTQAGNTTRLNLGGQDINPTVARTRTIISPVNSSTTAFVPTGGTAVDYSFENVSNLAFQPTGGTATYTQIQLRPTYNTTGSYSGTVRGLYYNPILTSLVGATHRAIETTTGDVIFGSTSGNVGIGLTGITSPTAKLHINNTTSGNTFLAEDDTNPDSTPFVIDASGNTGIGTLTPTQKLDVAGNIRLTIGSDRFVRIGSSTNYWYDLKTEGDNFKIFDGDGTTRFVLRYSVGSVGIGVTLPAAKLHVNNTTTGDSFLVEDSTNPDSTPFLIDASGNTGIGTLAPREKLDVNGNTIISSGLTATTINVPPLADDKIVYTTNNGRLTTTSAFTYNQSNNTFSVNNIDANGNFNITGNTTQSGNTFQIGNINITGNTTQFGNTFQIGDFNITGNTIQSGNTTQYGNIDLTGNTTQIGSVTLSGNTFITGNTDQIGNVNITGDTVIDGSLSADTITITNTPTLNNTLFQILGRNETTGDVEYRQVNTIGNNVTILTGGTYSAQTTIDNVIGVDTTLTTTTIYLPDSVSSGRLRFEIKDIGLNAYNNPITIIAAGTDTIISYTNSQTLIMESEGGAIILLNTGLGQWWQM